MIALPPGSRPTLFATIARPLVTISVVASLLFLIGIVTLYRERLHEQRAIAAAQMNLMLQVSLENAMLKRDIPGLNDIVTRLGQQEGIRAAMILDPAGRVRFSSDPALLDHSFDLTKPQLCPTCVRDGARPIESAELATHGINSPGAVIRSVKSVANRPECDQCHGNVAEHPINGLLVVDHDAADLKRNALLGAAALAGSGILVVLGLVAGIWHILRRNVLEPVASLTAASRALAEGRFSGKVAPGGGAEIAELGQAFNDMAGKLERSHAELLERQRFMQALIDALPDGVRVIDENFRIILSNRAYREQLGLDAEKSVGAVCYASSHRRSEPCIPTLTTCPLLELKAPGEAVKFHARHVRQDGADLSVEVSAVRLDIDGPTGPRRLVIEAIRDLDAALKISHEQRLSEIGLLATGMAHEIRNPLYSVAMLLQEVERTLTESPPEMAGPSLRLIEQEVERCLGITESLLKLGTPPGHSHQLIALGDIVHEVVALLRFEAEEAKVEIRTDIAPDLRVLASDSDLRIVLINLAQNAFHAMLRGGTLTIAAARREGRIALTVADTGVGIPPANIASIFLPFWSRRADGVSGTGLGLSICRSVLRSFSGTISVSSKPAQDTVFTIDLPDPDAGEIA